MIKSGTLRITVSAVIWTTLLFSANLASAHQEYGIQMKIPFDFYVGEKLLPAGDYEVMSWENAVRIRNATTHLTTGIQMLALKKDSGTVSIPQVVFNKFGDEYFLSEIWWGRGTSVGSMPISTPREVELAKAFKPVRIAARGAR